MNVETYEIEDASSEASAMANDAAALELIEKLGLTGQKSLLNADTVTRLPYRVMTEREALVFGLLCDSRTELETFAAEAIPVRVLQVAEHAKECGMFKRLVIWHPSVAKFDDPLLVGVAVSYPWAKDPNPTYHNLTRETFYMLARWGRELLPFEKLERIAADQVKAKRKSALVKAIAEAKTALAALDETTDVSVLAKEVSFSC